MTASLLRRHAGRGLLQTLCFSLHFLPFWPVTRQGVSLAGSACTHPVLTGLGTCLALASGVRANTRRREQCPEVRPPGLLPLEEEDALALPHGG